MDRVSFLDRITECNSHDLSGFLPLLVGGERVGWVRLDFAERLKPFGQVFEVTEQAVALAPALESFEARSAAVGTVLEELRAHGAVAGWRDEPYPVTTDFTAPPLLRMERAAIPRMGIRAYGIHMNGFVLDGTGINTGMKMWIARRARDKQTYPGMLDNMVAGGQPIGISLRDNLIKECREEAGIPPEIAARAVPVGCISYLAQVPEGLKPDVQFCYDLELPPSFTPEPVDGEIESFHLWPIEQVMEVVAKTTEFKFNCNLVIIDFLVRRGLIQPDEPDYVEIVQGLRR